MLKAYLKAPMLRSDLCDYNHAYSDVEKEITVTGTADAKNKKLNLKNNAL